MLSGLAPLRTPTVASARLNSMTDQIETKRGADGKYAPVRHNTPFLKLLVREMMDKGKDDTEIAKILMMDYEVKLYYSVRLIQEAKRERG